VIALVKLLTLVGGGMIAVLFFLLVLGLILESIRALGRGLLRLGSKLVGGFRHD
jgi:hypothetical protein